MGSVDTVCDMSNRHVSHGHPMDIVQSAYTPSQIEFHDLLILLFSSDLPTVKQFLLKQRQLKSVTLGELNGTMDVIDTVKVLKFYNEMVLDLVTSQSLLAMVPFVQCGWSL